MANKIISTADSTCDLNKELIERYSVVTFPLHISLGNDMFDDWVTITPEQIQNFEPWYKRVHKVGVKSEG